MKKNEVIKLVELPNGGFKLLDDYEVGERYYFLSTVGCDDDEYGLAIRVFDPNGYVQVKSKDRLNICTVHIDREFINYNGEREYNSDTNELTIYKDFESISDNIYYVPRKIAEGSGYGHNMEHFSSYFEQLGCMCNVVKVKLDGMGSIDDWDTMPNYDSVNNIVRDFEELTLNPTIYTMKVIGVEDNGNGEFD